MRDLHIACRLLVLSLDLVHHLLVVLLKQLDALFELACDFRMLIHEFLLLISMLTLQLDYFLLKIRDPFLELQLDKFFVAAGVPAHLIKHLLVFLPELVHLTLMFLGETDL
mmetsp:Transcript_5095/g.6236  ORF Transcript_5095/g.6236 Transcript_5095/m.6236 type:complete len:111 (-) Transcript_5095:108-440(-)